MAFQKPHTTKAFKDEHDVDGERNKEDGEEADDVKSDVDVDMDGESEVKKSAKDIKRAEPAVNGMNNGDAALVNGKGEWLLQSPRSESD